MTDDQCAKIIRAIAMAQFNVAGLLALSVLPGTDKRAVAHYQDNCHTMADFERIIDPEYRSTEESENGK